jgi:hypothetical protein
MHEAVGGLHKMAGRFSRFNLPRANRRVIPPQARRVPAQWTRHGMYANVQHARPWTLTAGRMDLERV